MEPVIEAKDLAKTYSAGGVDGPLRPIRAGLRLADPTPFRPKTQRASRCAHWCTGSTRRFSSWRLPTCS
jgi:hypothetical protein